MLGSLRHHLELYVKLVEDSDPDDCMYEMDFVNVVQTPSCFGAEHWTTQLECESEYEWDDSGDHCDVNGYMDSAVTEVDCVGGRWFPGSDYIKMKYVYYTRLFEGLQWLWGEANSRGLNDYFSMYSKARNTLRSFADDNQRITDSFYRLMDEVKKEFSNQAQTEGASTGVNTLIALAGMYQSLSELSAEKSKMYYDLSGMEVVFNPPNNHLTYADLINYGENRVAGSSTDYKLTGSNYIVTQDSALTQRNSTSNEWKNRTLLGVFKKINSMKPLNSGNASGRFNAHQGDSNCTFGRKRIGKTINGAQIDIEILIASLVCLGDTNRR